MSGGFDLAGPAAPPRPRGRPKGSTNKRAADLKGYIAAKFGGSAAQQAAALCMVTPAELKRAGGSMAKAQVNKALDLVHHVRQAQVGLDDHVRAIVREELEAVLGLYDNATATAKRELVNGFIRRVKDSGSGFTLKEALDLIGKERAALLPYTDQRQPLAVEAIGDGFRPSVVVMGASVENVGLSPVIEGQVSHVRSHDDGQALERLELFDLGASDGV
jgi:hypothetical protein